MAVKLPVPVGALRGLLKELSASTDDTKPLVIGGARELAAILRRDLGRRSRPGAVRLGDDPTGAAVYVHVVGGDDDEASLRRARRVRVPIVAVADEQVDSVPHVLATDIVRVRPGHGFPLEEIAAVIARRLGEDAVVLAAGVPALRDAVTERLIRSFARKNGILGAAIFIPGADMPILTLNELRLVLRLHQAYGLDIDPRDRVAEIAATMGAAFGLRALARELLDLLPFAGWAVKGSVAYAGTRTLGEVALRRLELDDRLPTLRRGGASRGAP